MSSQHKTLESGLTDSSGTRQHNGSDLRNRRKSNNKDDDDNLIWKSYVLDCFVRGEKGTLTRRVY